jgi:hypothetical protein
MHRFLRIVSGASLFALSWSTALFAGPGFSLEGVVLNAEPAVCLATPGPIHLAAYETGDFCDTGAKHGTSASCKRLGAAKGLFVCPHGYSATGINCSPGQACPNSGSWCSCTYNCSKATIADPEDPVDPEPIGD